MRVLGVVISPGRSGTASLSRMLSQYGGSDLRVFHEALKEQDTRPIEFFRSYDSASKERILHHPKISAYIEGLKALDSTILSIDTGWTLHPLLPLLASTFPDAIRVLHLTRNPITTAASMTLHGHYDTQTLRDFRMEQVLVEPGSPHSFEPSLATNWKFFSPFEKNLFRVCEIHRFGLEFPDRLPTIPFMRVRLEDFNDEVAMEIARFWGVPVPEGGISFPRSNATARLSRGARAVENDWEKVVRYKWVNETCQRLGYDNSGENLITLRSKMQRYSRHGISEHIAGYVYRFSPTRKLWRRVGSPLMKARAAFRRGGRGGEQ